MSFDQVFSQPHSDRNLEMRTSLIADRALDDRFIVHFIVFMRVDRGKQSSYIEKKQTHNRAFKPSHYSLRMSSLSDRREIILIFDPLVLLPDCRS